MERNGRRHGHNNRKWNDKNRNNKNQSTANVVARPKLVPRETQEDIQNKAKAIKEFRNKEVVCAVCGKPIEDLTSAMADKSSGKPIHFDCALDIAMKNEKLKENERFTYIGQGRFAVLSFADIRDQRHFKIEKIVEWEDKNKPIEWKSEISGLFSQT